MVSVIWPQYIHNGPEHKYMLYHYHHTATVYIS